jgi:hypothetical protein
MIIYPSYYYLATATAEMVKTAYTATSSYNEWMAAQQEVLLDEQR